ncbi:MAG: O-antigen ligase family protein [Parachlamydiales bacterium]|nr:O-antigen ligase family protein [Parachlamydiales bacterium]
MQEAKEKNNSKIVLIKTFYLILLLYFIPILTKNIDHVFNKHALEFFHFIDIFLVAAFLYAITMKKQKISKTFKLEEYLLIGFLLLLRISLFFASGEIHHKAYYDLVQYALAILMFFVLLSKAFHENKENVIKVFLFIFFTITLFEVIVGIMQFFMQKPLGFYFFNEPIFGKEVEGSAKIFISNNWLLSSLISNNTQNFLRAHGTFIHPNVFAGFLNISLFLTMHQLNKTKNKTIFSIFLFFQFVCLILTFSRAAIGSFVLCSSVFFILMYFKKYEIKKMALIFSTILLFAVLIFSKQFIERGFLGSSFQSSIAKKANIGSSNTRKELQMISVNMIKKRPILGVGFRNFIQKKDKFSDIKTERANVHNIYLLIASETGLVSLLILLIVIFVIFLKTVKYSLNPFTISVLVTILSFLIIGFFDHYPLSINLMRILLFSFLGFLNYENRINKPLLSSEKVFLYR